MISEYHYEKSEEDIELENKIKAIVERVLTENTDVFIEKWLEQILKKFKEDCIHSNFWDKAKNGEVIK